MASATPDFNALVAAWPAPVQLAHREGDLFVTMIKHPSYIEAKWTGYITAEDVVLSSQLYLLLLQKTPVQRLLNDKAEVSGDWAEANDWLEYEWLPKAIKAGMCCLAHVYSNNMFSRLSARDLYIRLSPTISIRNFSEREEAEQWLHTCHMAGNTIEPAAE